MDKWYWLCHHAALRYLHQRSLDMSDGDLLMRLSFLLFVASIAFGVSSNAQAHCQIPCGIYDDARVFSELKQHVETIARSNKGLAEAKTMHDAARWTMNKEQHAQKIQDTAQSYFLAQRVKPLAKGAEGYEDYVMSTTGLHQIIVAAMKAKQSTLADSVDALSDAIEAYETHYWGLHGHGHSGAKK